MLKCTNNKLLLVAITFVIIFSSFSTIIYAKDNVIKQKDIKIRASYNDNLTKSVITNTDKRVNLKSRNNVELKLLLSRADDIVLNEYNNINAEFRILSGEFQELINKDEIIKMEGSIYVNVIDEKLSVAGYLEGCNKNNELVGITLNSIPEINQNYMFVSIGSAGDDNEKYFIFGEVSEDLSGLSKKKLEFDEKFNDEKFNDEKSNQDLKTEDLSVKTSSRSPYTTDFRDEYIYSAYTWNGERVPLSAVSLYTPSRMYTNATYTPYAKVNASTQNARYYARNHMGIMGTISCSASGFVELGSSDELMAVWEPSPKDAFYSVNLPIPEISLPFGFTVSSLRLYWPSITVKLKSHSGSQYNNYCTWDYNNSITSDFSQLPRYMENGYTGCLLTTYQGNASSTDIYCKGEVTYTGVAVLGAQITNFHINTPTIQLTQNIILDTF